MTDPQHAVHLLICVVLATGMAVFGILFLTLKVPASPALRNYRVCRKILAILYFSYTIGASSALIFGNKLGNALESYMGIGLIFTSFQFTVATFALATLVNADYPKKRTVLPLLAPTLILAALQVFGLIRNDGSGFRRIVFRIFIGYGVVQLILAARIVPREIKRAMERMDNYFSGREGRLLSWIRPLFLLFMADGFLALLCFVVSFWPLLIFALIFSGAILFAVAVKVLNYAHDFELIAPVIAPGFCDDADGRDKGRRNRDKNPVRDDVEETIRQIDSFMRSSKPHFDPQLTIKTLGRKLAIPTNQLSELINGELGMNFRNYVNSFRIREVKRILAEEAETNILEVALKSGFNSKSSFNAAFIKETGMTPREWRRRFSGKKGLSKGP